MKKQWLTLVFFGLFWSSLVLLFDGICGYGVINQLRAQWFPHVTGNITQSETTEQHDSDGSTTGVDIRYHYEIDGKPFEGTRYRYVAGSSSDSEWAHEAVHRYEVGSEVPVFYDPKNPSESLLSPGLDGSNYVWLLFLTPFNMVMLGLWFSGAIVLRNKFSRSTNGRAKTFQDGYRLRIRLPRYPAWVLGMAVTGLIAFIETFPIVFTTGFHPKTGIAAAAVTIAYGTGLLVTAWQWRKARSGLYDLIIDERDGSFEMPLTFGRKTRVPISSSNVAGVVVDTVSQNNNSSSYVATVVLCDQKPSDGKIAEWCNEADAENFVAWLRPQLKILPSNQKPASWKASMPINKDAGDKT